MLHILFFFCAWAAAQTSTFKPAPTSRLKFDELKEESPRSWNLSATLFENEYLSAGRPYFRGDAADNNRGVALSLHLDQGSKAFGYHLNLRDEYSATEQWNYLNVPEAYLTWRPGAAQNLALGRKLDRWSDWDSEWRQGIFQPRYLQNRLRPEEAGLAGLFYENQHKQISYTLGFLPVAIPDFGPHHYVEDDHFVSKNPWFSPPAREFEFRQERGEIHYSLDKPNLKEGALHAGGVGKVEYRAAKNYFGRLSAAYKPMPQFLLGFPSRGQFVVGENEDIMNVRVTPRLVYHALFSHDSEMRWENWTLALSLTREVPDRDASAVSDTAQQVQPATIYAASLARPLESEGPYAARARLSFLKVQGGDAPDRGDFAGRTSLFERRYQYQEAYSLGLSKAWRKRLGAALETELRLIYDRLQNGGVLSFSAGMNFSRELRADFQLDFLGLLAGRAEVTDGFLALYRANDRVGLGLSYVY